MSDAAHNASCTLREMAQSHRRSLELIDAMAQPAPVTSVWTALVAEAQCMIDALELGAAALESVHAFSTDTDGPPLCPFCKMPYRPTPNAHGVVS